MTKIEQGRSLNEIKEVDDLTYSLWKRCVTPEEQKDPGAMMELIQAIESSGLYPTTPTNPILKKMVEDGAGFDGFNAAMMTLSYVRELCRYYGSLTNEERLFSSYVTPAGVAITKIQLR